MLIPIVKLREAQEVLLQHGFAKQHERIFTLDHVEGARGVQCLFGFDDAGDAGHYEVNVRCLERPVERGRKGADIARVRVIQLADAPAKVRQAAEAALRALQALGEA
ncbi:hypothetical protein GCM10010885_02800 [Alicyclobacillus cellulosilyticus]|uniref:Uncharacterized protein n=1 Tax=Alicyclobacillus cellulosilyticus TaxID=1003997 RepID=A0A917K1R0_9BACL|nr:hypothetical protein [Alicyclobacillus cellulosilyticus]GGI96505.1 hypothetical protein GCM10010885_02800 [Alicyclobacillus cellulosilyticus]